MSKSKVGVLHPGQMGVVVAATMRNSGHEVFWASEGRSRETCRRAADAGLTDAISVGQLCEICSVLVSVCPPEFAEGLARAVAGHSFRGLYLDANAISPQRTRRIGELLSGHGAAFLDGCIIGMPTSRRGETWLYVSGENAGAAASFFAAGPLECEVIGGEIGQASALKMCFAAHSKRGSGPAGRRRRRGRSAWRAWRSGAAMVAVRSERSARSGIDSACRAEGLAIRRRDEGDRQHVRSGGHSAGISECSRGDLPADGGLQERQ